MVCKPGMKVNQSVARMGIRRAAFTRIHTRSKEADCQCPCEKMISVLESESLQSQGFIAAAHDNLMDSHPEWLRDRPYDARQPYRLVPIPANV